MATTNLEIGFTNICCTFQWVPNELSNIAIQNMAFSSIDSSYCYTTQRVDATTHLIKYHRGSNTLAAYGVWHYALPGYGHGETLECTPSSVASKEFIWVGCAANANPSGKYWSTQIARLYVLHNGDGFAVERTKILKNFKYASATGTAINSGTVKRIIAAINDDYSRICFKIHFPKSENTDSVYYAIYDLAKINKLLNNADSSVSMKDATSAYIMGFEGSPIDTFQSMTIKSTNLLYISSGNLNNNVENLIREYRYNTNGMTLQRTFNFTFNESAANNINCTLSTAEIEGIKAYGSALYMTFNFSRDSSGVDSNRANRTPLITKII